MHADGSGPPSLHITPKLRVCDKIPLLPLYVASFWSSIQTPVSQEKSPKGSSSSLMFPQGISVQERNVEGWLVTSFSSQQVTQAMVLMGLGGFILNILHVLAAPFILDIPHGLAAPRQMLHALISTCRSPYRHPGMPRLTPKGPCCKAAGLSNLHGPGQLRWGLGCWEQMGIRWVCQPGLKQLCFC